MLDIARLLFEQQTELAALAYKMLSQVASLLHCERAQLLLVDDRVLNNARSSTSSSASADPTLQLQPTPTNDFFDRLCNESKLVRRFRSPLSFMHVYLVPYPSRSPSPSFARVASSLSRASLPPR